MSGSHFTVESKEVIILCFIVNDADFNFKKPLRYLFLEYSIKNLFNKATMQNRPHLLYVT